MPKPEDEEEDLLDKQGEDKTVDLDEDGGEGEDGKKVIDLDEEEEIEAAKREFEKENKKVDNAAFAKMRIEMKKLKKENEELKAKPVVTPQRTVAPAVVQQQPEAHREIINGVQVPSTEEEWDALVRKDWRTAVDLRSVINARKIQTEHTTAERSNKTLEDSKQKVAGRHPELLDANSEKTRIFLQVLEENPDYRTNPKGPIYAMRDMEDRMEAMGHKREDIIRAAKDGQQQEHMRQSRVTVSSVAGRSSPANGKQVTLTKEDLEFCKLQDIDPKVFAQQKFALSKKGLAT